MWELAVGCQPSSTDVEKAKDIGGYLTVSEAILLLESKRHIRANDY